MQNLEVKDVILTTKKQNPKSRKSLKAIAKGNKNKNTDIEQITKNCTESEEDATKVIREFEEIIKNKKSDIIWLVYHQSKTFHKF